MIKTTLVIGDSHVEANDPDLNRFTAVGNLIAEERFDNVIQIGDFLSLDSLSAWDLRKSAKMEGRRFSEELTAGKEAVDRIMTPIYELQDKQRISKKRVYRPKLYSCIGNHEDRWDRYLETKPELLNVVDPYESVGFEDHGWVKVPYREYIYIEGVGFTHAPMNGNNQPASGVSLLNNASKDHQSSVVFGHTHSIGLKTHTRHGDNCAMVTALNVGCFFNEIPEYAQGSITSKNWWSGVFILEHYGEGLFDFRSYKLERLMENYL